MTLMDTIRNAQNFEILQLFIDSNIWRKARIILKAIQERYTQLVEQQRRLQVIILTFNELSSKSIISDGNTFIWII